VKGVRWGLSLSHKGTDICDTHATGGPEGNGIYPPDKVPAYPAHPHCVTPGQLVETIDGQLPIERIMAGDLVLTHAGRYQRVIEAWNSPHDGLVYKIKTNHGEFELTANHPVLTADGWVNADSVKAGDQVLYAASCISLNGISTISKNEPAPTFEPSITPGIVFDVPVMPTTVAFNGNFEFGNCEVNEEPPDLIFSNECDTHSFEFPLHSNFDTGGVVEPLFSGASEHGHKSGVTSLFGTGYFATDFRPFGGVILSRHGKPGVDFLESPAGYFASSPIVFFPCDSNPLLDGADFNTDHIHQISKSPEGYAEHFANFGIAEPFCDVEVEQNIVQRTAGLGFDSQLVPFGDTDVMGTAMIAIGTLKNFAAQGAGVIEFHDNLLSLSPDSQLGHGSGSPSVSRVATPAQALTYYSTVESVSKRQYQGPVYNMHVAGDNSYTVNGAAVHNCLCALSPVPVGNVGELVQQLRLDILSGSSRIRPLQGLFNVTFFVNAMLTGLFTDIVERLREAVEI
jgi:hypothetical protein